MYTLRHLASARPCPVQHQSRPSIHFTQRVCSAAYCGPGCLDITKPTHLPHLPKTVRYVLYWGSKGRQGASGAQPAVRYCTAQPSPAQPVRSADERDRLDCMDEQVDGAERAGGRDEHLNMHRCCRCRRRATWTLAFSWDGKPHCAWLAGVGRKPSTYVPSPARRKD